MSRNRNRRPQAPKGRNVALMEGMQELRKGNRAQPIPTKVQKERARRRPKHMGRGWE